MHYGWELLIHVCTNRPTSAWWWRHEMETVSALLAFCAGNSPIKYQWRGALMFSLIWACFDSWANNGDAGDLRRHSAHYDAIVMMRVADVLAPGHAEKTVSRETYCLTTIDISKKKIPQCVIQISHNAPFCNINVHTFTKWCIVGCGTGALCDLCNWLIKQVVFEICQGVGNPLVSVRLVGSLCKWDKAITCLNVPIRQMYAISVGIHSIVCLG